MKNIKNESIRIFELVCKFIIFIVIALSFVYILYNLQYKILHTKGDILFIFLYLFIFGLFSNIYKCFEIGIFRIRQLLVSYSISIIITNFIAYLILSLIYKKFIYLPPMIILILVQMIFGVIFYWSANNFYFYLHPPKNTLVICRNTKEDLNFINKFIHYKKRRYKICQICYEPESFDKLIVNFKNYPVIILGNVSYELRNRVINYCFENNKYLFLIPSTEDIILRYSNITHINDTPVFVFKNEGLSIEQKIIKRTIDIAISFICIIVSSPLLLITSLAIKLYDNGPILYKQERYTKNSNKFNILKFRSMEINAERNGPQITTYNDNRVTPIGRIIRLTHIDELPQFFNILHGEMSLVGPRAERIENYIAYSKIMPEFSYRMKVKAGLTGYAQIYGQYNTSYSDKLKMDLNYIENFSLLLDLQLLFATIKVIFNREKTEGFLNANFINNEINNYEEGYINE